jgi:hypothetical protein
VFALPAGGISSDGSFSVAWGASNEVALGVEYIDNTRAPGLSDPNNDHPDLGCCHRAAIAAWRWGTKPPRLHELSTFSEGLIHPPQVAVDTHGRVFAAWSVFAGVNEKLMVARKRGGPYSIKTLFVDRSGYSDPENGDIGNVAWMHDAGGDPSLGWTWNNGGSVSVARTASSGSWGPVHTAPLADDFDVGFATDGAGRQLLAYEDGGGLLWMSPRIPGVGFSRPRRAVVTDDNTFTVSAGGEGRVVVGALYHGHLFARIGTIAGGLGPPQDLGTNVFDLNSAVDHRGRATLVFDTSPKLPQHRYLSRVWLATAPPHGLFGRPVLVSGTRRNCDISTRDEPPIVEGPGGRALISWTCGPPDQTVAVSARLTPQP